MKAAGSRSKSGVHLHIDVGRQPESVSRVMIPVTAILGSQLLKVTRSLLTLAVHTSHADALRTVSSQSIRARATVMNAATQREQSIHRSGGADADGGSTIIEDASRQQSSKLALLSFRLLHQSICRLIDFCPSRRLLLEIPAFMRSYFMRSSIFHRKFSADTCVQRPEWFSRPASPGSSRRAHPMCTVALSIQWWAARPLRLAMWWW